MGYGMTETIWLTICRTPDLIKKSCIGKLLESVILSLVNATGEKIHCGEIGEILKQLIKHFSNEHCINLRNAVTK